MRRATFILGLFGSFLLYLMLFPALAGSQQVKPSGVQELRVVRLGITGMT